MGLTWLKTAMAGLLAFAALIGLFAVWHDQPYVYPVAVRTGWLTGLVRATPRHVVVGSWLTRNRDLRRGGDLYWEGAGLGVYTETIGGREERSDADADFRNARRSARIGQFGVLWGRPREAGWELHVPTWLAVLAGVAPLAVVVVGRLRSRGRVAEGQCPVCGYDLRATPGRCPECGTAASAPAVAG
jgi:hypothetical protein